VGRATIMGVIEEIVFGPFRLDGQDERLWRDGQIVPLRPKALAVLRYLLERAPRLVKKRELLDALWPGVAVGDAVLTTSLKEIRRALRDSARQPRYVETAHGHGYRFIGAIERASTARNPAPGPSRARVMSAGSEPPLIGRERQRALLEAALERARAGQRQLVFVTGEPGIGKTALLDAFLAEAADEPDVFVARSRCVTGHSEHEAYLPLLDACARLFRRSATSPLCGRLLAAAPSWFSSSARAASGGAQAAPAKTLRPSLRELAEALEHGTEQSTLVLCFDDLHFADAATLDLVHYLAQRPEPARLLVVCSYGALEGSTAQRQRVRRLERSLRVRRACSVVSVALLDEREVDAYIARRFPGHRFPAVFSTFVHARTTGKPGFVHELLESWVERGWIAANDGRHELTCSLELLAYDVPDSITAAIEAELQALAPLPRSILQAGSVAGHEFSALAVARALCLSVARVERECLELDRNGRYLRKSSRLETNAGVSSHCFAFVHALQREVIAEGLGVARRTELQRRLGAVQRAHVPRTLTALALRSAPDNDAVTAPRRKLPLVAP